MTKVVTVNLTLTGQPQSGRIPLEIEEGTTATQLLTNVSSATKIPLGQLKLIYRGRMIKNTSVAGASDADVIDEYKLQQDCVVHCMGTPVATTTSSNAPQAPSSTAPAGSSVTVSAAATAATAGGVASTSPNEQQQQEEDPLQKALKTLKTNNPSPQYVTGLQTLHKLLTNIHDSPLEEKYRKMKKKNPAFVKRLGGLQGGHDAMIAVGFHLQMAEGEEKYVMVPSADAWPKLVKDKQTLEQAIQQQQQQQSSASTASTPAPFGAAMPGMGGAGMGGMPGMGGAGMPGAMGGMPGAMDDAMAQFLSNPQQVQAMLQNPMVRQMIQNDPRMAQNPQMMQQLDSLIQNPQALESMTQMMSNPQMRQQMQQMSQMMQQNPELMQNNNPQQMQQAMMQNPQLMQQMMSSMMMGGGMGGTNATNNNLSPPAGGGTAAPPSGSNNTNTTTNNNNQTDEEMTEEEMIAEAIRRSMGEES